MSTVYILNKIPVELLIKYQGTLDKFIQDPKQSGLNLKQLKNGLFRIKANDKVRLLFVQINDESTPTYVLVDILEDHKYNTNRFHKYNTNRFVTDTPYLEHFRKVITLDLKRQKEEPDEVPLNKNNSVPSFQTIDFSPRWVTLTDDQQNILPLPLPLVLTGTPGSGKTVVAMSLLQQMVSVRDEGTKPVGYISNCPGR